jgi:hypothetical protein
VEAAARAELARQIAAANAELRQLQAAKKDAERQEELQVKCRTCAAGAACYR